MKNVYKQRSDNQRYRAFTEELQKRPIIKKSNWQSSDQILLTFVTVPVNSYKTTAHEAETLWDVTKFAHFLQIL
jgi:hypothetical protein